MYLLFITTSIGIYYTPKLSELKTNIELRREIKNGYTKIVPFTILLAIVVYFFRENIVRVAFSESFLPMLELFKWQLMGDVLKISSYLLSTIMIAKAMTKKYIYSEIFFSCSFTFLSILLINNYGLIGVTYAYLTNFVFYSIFLIYSFKWLFYEK